jgi:ADP-ribose pyrophosphatase YjhB (NUDIX family)
VTQPGQPPKHSVSVAAAIIDDDGRFLTIRRADNGHWEPPGGVLELHESIPDGLTREVHEETGLRVNPLALTGVYKNMRRGIVALVFRCEVVGGAPHPSHEASELAWLTPEQLKTRMSDAYRVRLLDAVTEATTAHVRAHDGTRLVASSNASRIA